MCDQYHSNIHQTSMPGGRFRKRTPLSATLCFDKHGNISATFLNVNNETEEQLIRSALERLVRPSLFRQFLSVFRRIRT